jgi:hypothetical protein
MKQLLTALAGAVIAVGIFLVGQGTTLQNNFGSVAVSNEYIATSTAPDAVYGATISTSRRIKNGAGALGQVTITGAGAGLVNFYNATTSNVNLRTGNTPTSTILIASIPLSAAAGTYVFDAQFTRGLYIDITGTAPTSTVTYR